MSDWLMTAVGPPPWATRIFTGLMCTPLDEDTMLQRAPVAMDVVRDEGVVALGALQPFGMRQGVLDVGLAAGPVVAHRHGAELVVLGQAVPFLVLVDELDHVDAARAGLLGGRPAGRVLRPHVGRDLLEQLAQQAALALLDGLRVGDGAGAARVL